MQHATRVLQYEYYRLVTLTSVSLSVRAHLAHAHALLLGREVWLLDAELRAVLHAARLALLPEQLGHRALRLRLLRLQLPLPQLVLLLLVRQLLRVSQTRSTYVSTVYSVHIQNSTFTII